MVGDSVF